MCSEITMRPVAQKRRIHSEDVRHKSLRPRPSRSAAFTLVELLVVIAILGLVMSLVGPQVMKQLAGAKRDTAGLQIDDLGAALDLFYLDMGRYPTSDEGLAALVRAPNDSTGWNGPYLKNPRVPNDPWEQSFEYKVPGEHGAYDLTSFGADGRAGGTGDDADIVSWQ